MADNKTPLTDAEIKTSLKCCTTANCDICPSLFRGGDDMDCRNEMIKTTLDLINRKDETIEALISGQETLQKALSEKNAEIERLKKELNIVSILYEDEQERYNELLDSKCDRCIAKDKAEAIKEFAERLKNKIISDTAYGCDSSQHSGYYDYSIKIGDIPEYIDNLVAEMVGESK